MATRMSDDHSITEAIKSALDERPASEVLSVVTGNFVGLLLALTEQGGGDPDKEIHIDGGSGRDITIHAKKKGGVS